MKRAILLFTVVVSCFLLTSCGSPSTEDMAKQNIKEAMQYYLTQYDAMKEYAVPLDDDSTVGIYYSELVMPVSLSKSYFNFDYVGAYDPDTKYGQTIPDFEEAIEWYEYAYDSGSLSPDSEYKQDLDKWVNYYISHPESIPVVTGKQGKNALLKYVQDKTGHSTYRPDEDAFGISTMRQTYLVFNTDDTYYIVGIFSEDYFDDMSTGKQFNCHLLDTSEVSWKNGEYFDIEDFRSELLPIIDRMREAFQQ